MSWKSSAVTILTITTPCCRVCGEASQMEVNAWSYAAWQGGMLIQEAFPVMPKEVREMLITGTHPACWESMFDEGNGVGV